MYSVVYETRWLKKLKPCGYFHTVAAAKDYINYLLLHDLKLKFFIKNAGG